MQLVTWSLLRGQWFIESPNITQSRIFKLKSVISFWTALIVVSQNSWKDLMIFHSPTCSGNWSGSIHEVLQFSRKAIKKSKCKLCFQLVKNYPCTTYLEQYSEYKEKHCWFGSVNHHKNCLMKEEIIIIINTVTEKSKHTKSL